MDWLSDVDKDSQRVGMKQKQVIEQNGTHFQEGDGKLAIGEEDEVNGNLLETDVDGPVGTTEENLNQQYQKVKVRGLKHNDTVKFYFQVGKHGNNLAHVLSFQTLMTIENKVLFSPRSVIMSNVSYCENCKQVKNNETSIMKYVILMSEADL